MTLARWFILRNKWSAYILDARDNLIEPQFYRVRLSVRPSNCRFPHPAIFKGFSASIRLMLRNQHPDRDDNVGANSKKFIVWLDRLLAKERKEAISARVQLRKKFALVVQPLECSEIRI